MTYEEATNKANEYSKLYKGKIATKNNTEETFTIKDILFAETNQNQYTIYCILIPFPDDLNVKLPTIPPTMEYVLKHYRIDGLNLRD